MQAVRLASQGLCAMRAVVPWSDTLGGGEWEEGRKEGGEEGGEKGLVSVIPRTLAQTSMLTPQCSRRNAHVQIMMKMAERLVHRLVIVDEGGVLVGILSLSDVLSSLIS